MIYLKNTVLREKFDKLHEIYDNEGKFIDEKISDFDGITLIETHNPFKDRFAGKNCFSYYFGNEKIKWDYNIDDPEVDVTGGHFEVKTPGFGDLVVYIDSKIKETTHIGKYVGLGNVVSKWTYGNTYLHSLNLVPSSFGDKVRFFRYKTAPNPIKGIKTLNLTCYG